MSAQNEGQGVGSSPAPLRSKRIAAKREKRQATESEDTGRSARCMMSQCPRFMWGAFLVVAARQSLNARLSPRTHAPRRHRAYPQARRTQIKDTQLSQTAARWCRAQPRRTGSTGSTCVVSCCARLCCAVFTIQQTMTEGSVDKLLARPLVEQLSALIFCSHKTL